MSNCVFVRARYLAVGVWLAYERRLVGSRQGVSIARKQLEPMVRLMKRRLSPCRNLESIRDIVVPAR